MRPLLIVLAFIGMLAGRLAAIAAFAAETSGIKLDVMGETSAGTKTAADVTMRPAKKSGRWRRVRASRCSGSRR
jgi:hypothetical protein